MQSWAKVFVLLDVSNEMVNYSHLLIVTWLVVTATRHHSPEIMTSRLPKIIINECDTIES